MFRSGMKFGGLFLVLASLVVFSACGEESAPTQTSAVVGPTSPGGFYFELTMSPSIFESGGTSTVTVRVWDSSGFPASGVVVSLTGSVEDGDFFLTGTNGIAAAILTTDGEGSGPSSITATVESLSATVSYVIVPKN